MAENLKACIVPCKFSWADLAFVCRRHRLTCQDLKVNKNTLDDYEVEYLCDYKKFRGEELYLVKWRGYPETDNSWEPKRNLKCTALIKEFHHDLQQELRGQQKCVIPRNLNKDISLVLTQKAKHRLSLQCWQNRLNEKRMHPGRILVLNDVDFEGPPGDFKYINNCKVVQGIVPNKMALGCKCTNCLEEPVNGCCPGASLHRMAYNDKGRVRVRPGYPIYECNSSCSCGPGCPNRIVQKGIQFDLCIFKTDDGRGWGVRTLQHIRKNAFVMEYVGEIITTDEAEMRGHQYDRQGSTYLFDLDYVDDVYTVDATHQGNISRFVNHSCDPNLQVYNVFVDNIDERIPRIGLFSNRPIRAGEELTFDYKMQVAPSSPKRVRVECRCGSDTCRKFLF